MNMTPQEISDVTLAFPVKVLKLMPEYDSIPKEYRDMNSRNQWTEFQEKWFFQGLKGATITAKEGIDKKLALRHLSAIQGSFEPKHEHKRAAVAFLASQWFESWDEGETTSPEK